jgi:tripartite-type tricarboxylate transporter receptor subunit TctC
VKTPDVQGKLGALGMQLVGGSPDDLAALMKTEIPRWAELVRTSGASVT